MLSYCECAELEICVRCTLVVSNCIHREDKLHCIVWLNWRYYNLFSWLRPKTAHVLS